MNENLSRLDAVQASLQQRGALDVKFFFAPEASAVPPSKVLEDLTTVLEQYLVAPKNPLAFNDAAKAAI